MQSLIAYIPMDRRQAMARGETLPDRTMGAALFADILGFTPLARAFAEELGTKRGAEALLSVLNPVFEALIGPVHHYGGSVIGFAGDAVTCWFEEKDEGASESKGGRRKDEGALSLNLRNSSFRATACALAMQEAMEQSATVQTSAGMRVVLHVKVAVAAGPARRFLVGDPAIKLIDALAGAMLARMAIAEKQAERGQVVVSRQVAQQLEGALTVTAWREDAKTGGRFAVVGGLARQVKAVPWTTLPENALTGEQLRQWVLPAVYAQLRSQAGRLGDLRSVTPLMLRFGGIGFDADETAGEKLDAFVRRAQHIIHHHGGNLIQLAIGDKGTFLYATFGAPVAHEDDPVRAMRAALALRAVPAELDYISAMQIGLTRGEVWTGVYGAAARRTYSAIGSDVNLSARLMTKAQPGQILISEQMRQQWGATAHFKLEHLGDWFYKGFAEPIPTYELCSERLADERVFSEAMVGRDAELQQLVDFAHPLFGDPVVAGQLAGVAIIYGEAGIGKSRLSYALCQAIGDRVTWFSGQTDQILRQAFNPFIYWLKHYFDQSPEATPEENKANFDHRLNHLLELLDHEPSPDAKGVRALDELVRTRSILGAVMGLHWPDSLYERLDAKGRHENTLFAIKALLLAESRLRPVVLELEDGHWLDESSHELLTLLTRNISDYPLLLVITSRYADDGSQPAFALAPEAPTLTMNLNVLSPASLSALAQSILGRPIDEMLYTLLQEKTQANPFFVQQVLYYLQENDLLKQGPDGGWSAKAAAFDVPSSINVILIARIDRLAQQVKEIVQTAAVLGREFEVQVLSQMLRVDVLPQVQSAEREQIWIALRELRYLFKHALLRDAAYEMQLRARRRELHRLAAMAMESLYQDNLAEHYGELAYHYEAAYQQGLVDMQEQAAAYLRCAGEQATANYENAAAVGYFSRVLDLTSEDDLAERYTLTLAREKVYDLMGEREAQAQDLATLEKLVEDDQAQVELALRRANYAEATSDYPRAIMAAQTAIEMAQSLRDENSQAEGYLIWGRALWRQGDYEHAHTYLRQSLGLAQATDDRQTQAVALRDLGVVARILGQYEQASRYCEQSLAISQEIGDRATEGTTLDSLGAMAWVLGQYEQAIRYFEPSLAISQEIGDRATEGTTLNNLGVVAWSQGQYEQAARYYEQSLAISQEIGNQANESIALGNLGLVAYALGQYEQAIRYFEQSLAITQEIGNRSGEGFALTGLGDVQTNLSQWVQAEATLQAAITLRQELGHQTLLMESQTTLARLYLAQAQPKQALAALADVLVYLEEGQTFDGTDYGLRNYLTCYQVLQAVTDPRAAGILRTAYEALRKKAARIPDEPPRRSFLENVP